MNGHRQYRHAKQHFFAKWHPFHGQPGHKHEKEQITQPSHVGQENTAAMKKARQSDSNGLGNIGERRGDHRRKGCHCHIL